MFYYVLVMVLLCSLFLVCCFFRGMRGCAAAAWCSLRRDCSNNSSSTALQNPSPFFLLGWAHPAATAPLMPGSDRGAQLRPLDASAPLRVQTSEGHSRSIGASTARLNLLRTRNFHHCLLSREYCLCSLSCVLC